MRKVGQSDQKRRGALKGRPAPQQRLHAAMGMETPPLDERIGGVIRRIRLERGLTLGDVASAAGISVPMLSRFETAHSSASLLLLARICATLGMNLSTLFSEVEQTRGEAGLIKTSDQMEVVRSGTKYGYTYRLLSHWPRRVFEPFLINIDKRSKTYPRFQHQGTEFVYMLRGRMQYRFEDKTLLLEPGDAFTFSGYVPHGPEKLLDDDIQFITMIIYPE
ncbi:XRE family transcriptional regulator [Bradyrhizobium sp. ISRA443]|uniref:helix-turn-helix domain-containing protein n=1 Tax=unclassified Bradyrhizobium TaxID=2631580 RepID=UPI00247AC11B|nr:MULTISPECIES: XRE family transcriptional regulator [unclassified Bradyrhizobium]WGR98035.1 XRE family transcriptional regulator [Bradyrhizobium sp. ISRA436]WGS04924.1 XRE family transcriptional regulator [Bradyrhizobium sp. ISRA437]WGS11808.1 XRE family transcriptional regulator [Bradyrhizobium sp. ISRA443]